MNVLLLGGTGLISTGIIKHLLIRGADVTMFNRGKRDSTVDKKVQVITGDRNTPADLAQCTAGGKTWDVVIDMIAFSPQQAQASIDTFRGKCKHFIFCSTVCTYGVKIPPGVLIDETFPQEPISDYGRGKVACEKRMLEAHHRGDFAATIIRPSSTYGPGGHLVDNLEFDPVAWDRIAKGLPVLCAGDGLGLWVSTHRDDCGKLFAYAAMNPKTYGESYNATRDRVFTWRDLYHEAALALGKEPNLAFLPAATIIAADPKRFGLLREITQFHGAYTSEKAKRDVPEYRCEIDYIDGAHETLESIKARGAWKSCEKDPVYEALLEKSQSNL